MGLFGGGFFSGSWLNPAGKIHEKQTEGSRRQAAATQELARIQEQQYQASIAEQTRLRTVEQEKLALGAENGSDTRYATVESGAGASTATGGLFRKRTRGASANITLGI